MLVRNTPNRNCNKNNTPPRRSIHGQCPVISAPHSPRGGGFLPIAVKIVGKNPETLRECNCRDPCPVPVHCVTPLFSMIVPSDYVPLLIISMKNNKNSNTNSSRNCTNNRSPKRCHVVHFHVPSPRCNDRHHHHCNYSPTTSNPNL